MSSLDGGTELQAMFIHDDYMSESIEVADSNYVTSNTVDVVANVTSDENGESGNGENVQVDGSHALSVESKLCSSVDKSVVIKLTVEHEEMSFFNLLPIVG